MVFKGQEDSDLTGGIYHAELDLSGYPAMAPSIMILHDNGSVHPNMHLCIHRLTNIMQSNWVPGTTLVEIIYGLRTFMEQTIERTGIGIINPYNGAAVRKYAVTS